MSGEPPGNGAPTVEILASASLGTVLATGCRLYRWSWCSGSGTHELSVPPQAAATPEPTPQAVPTFESRY